jgi:hypothetical protein
MPKAKCQIIESGVSVQQKAKSKKQKAKTEERRAEKREIAKKGKGQKSRKPETGNRHFGCTGV